MADTLTTLLKLTIKVGFWIGMISAFIVFLNLAYSSVGVALNGSVLADLFLLIQMWLPFNFGVMLTWVLVASVSYLFYRLMLFAIGAINVWVT